TFRHGFPYSPTALAYDPVQKLLAIGDKSGTVRILGRFGVDAHVKHEGESACAVNLIEFLVNEGSLVTATADDTLHLWNFHTKIPKVVQSLKFQRERITHLHLPVGTKWLYVGTEKGNTHIVHADSFSLSGYIINWNKAIDPIRKTHPGAVVHLSDNPLDPNKLLIGFETGQLVLWDMRGKCAELRWISQEPLLSCSWHHEGKHFITSHSDGSLCTWPLKLSPKPLVHGFPHAKTNKDGKIEACNAIQKVEVKTNRLGEQFTIFSGGLPTEKCSSKSHCITVLVQGKSTTVLEMEHPVIDFITICESPWSSDLQEPYAVAVLLQNDLVLIDLLTTGYPTFESPYSMDIHESPVTCCTYLADCPSDLVPAFYSVGRSASNRRSGYSEREWPINGGEWQPTSCSYSEIVLTGHQDGSIKFWDSSAGTLQVLYKLKTSKIFEKSRVRSMDVSDDDPLSISAIALCAESRKLCIATNSGHVALFKFKRAESTGDIAVLEIPISYENAVDNDGSPECEFIPKTLPKQTDSVECEKKYNGMLKVKSGPQRKPPGFQAQLVCITPWTHGTHPGQITALTINSSYGLMAYGNEYGLAVVDIVQKICLLNLSTQEIYGSLDMYIKTPRSPKRLESVQSKEDQLRSPSIDQVSSFDLLDNSFSRSRSSSMSSLENASTEAVTCLAFADSYIKKNPSLALPTMWLGTSLGAVLTVSLNIPDQEARKSEAVQAALAVYNRSFTLSKILLIFIDCMHNPPCSNHWLRYISQYNIVDLKKLLFLPFIGPVFRLKGSVLSMSLLDCNGALIPYAFESWKDDGREGKEKRDSIPFYRSTALILTSCCYFVETPTKQTANKMSPTNPDSTLCDRQFIVIASEKQAGVFALPSQNCVYKKNIVETDFVVKAEIISMKDSVCLICYASNGHLIVFTLPSLKLLLDIDFLPLSELSFQTKCKQGIIDPMLSIWGQQLIVNEDTNLISKTFSFSNKGHGLYLVTPTELQKFTVCQEFCNQYNEMLGELYVAHEMPEAPKESFFKGLFGGGMRNLDREELFGESSGKANKSVAKHIPGPNANLQDLDRRATSASSEVSRAHQLMLERGDKLSQLEERTERMASEAQQFSSSAHLLMNKYKDKKWYQL
ncbi:AAEL006948-PA, partial [Aedes aegypti]